MLELASQKFVFSHNIESVFTEICVCLYVNELCDALTGFVDLMVEINY